jgi:GNAT superfamily N-acetyltransferase
VSLADGFHDVPAGKLAAVVTHLEMTKKNLRGAALPGGLTFAELPRDVALYKDVFARIGAPWLWFGRLVMDETDLRDMLEDPKVTLHTLIKAGCPEALLELDFRTPGMCKLAYFGLTQKIIGIGAGAYLMDRAIEMGFCANISCLTLHTCTLDSPEALQFYIRSGFTPTHRQVEIADDPRLLGVYPREDGARVPLV